MGQGKLSHAARTRFDQGPGNKQNHYYTIHDTVIKDFHSWHYGRRERCKGSPHTGL